MATSKQIGRQYAFPSITFNETIVGPAPVNAPWRNKIGIVGNFSKGPDVINIGSKQEFFAYFGDDLTDGSIAVKQIMAQGATDIVISRVTPTAQPAVGTIFLGKKTNTLFEEGVVGDYEIATNASCGFKLRINQISDPIVTSSSYFGTSETIELVPYVSVSESEDVPLAGSASLSATVLELAKSTTPSSGATIRKAKFSVNPAAVQKISLIIPNIVANRNKLLSVLKPSATIRKDIADQTDINEAIAAQVVAEGLDQYLKPVYTRAERVVNVIDNYVTNITNLNDRNAVVSTLRNIRKDRLNTATVDYYANKSSFDDMINVTLPSNDTNFTAFKLLATTLKTKLQAIKTAADYIPDTLVLYETAVAVSDDTNAASMVYKSNALTSAITDAIEYINDIKGTTASSKASNSSKEYLASLKEVINKLETSDTSDSLPEYINAFKAANAEFIKNFKQASSFKSKAATELDKIDDTDSANYISELTATRDSIESIRVLLATEESGLIAGDVKDSITVIKGAANGLKKYANDILEYASIVVDGEDINTQLNNAVKALDGETKSIKQNQSIYTAEINILKNAILILSTAVDLEVLSYPIITDKSIDVYVRGTTLAAGAASSAQLKGVTIFPNTEDTYILGINIDSSLIPANCVKTETYFLLKDNVYLNKMTSFVNLTSSEIGSGAEIKLLPLLPEKDEPKRGIVNTKIKIGFKTVEGSYNLINPSLIPNRKINTFYVKITKLSVSAGLVLNNDNDSVVVYKQANPTGILVEKNVSKFIGTPLPKGATALAILNYLRDRILTDIKLAEVFSDVEVIDSSLPYSLSFKTADKSSVANKTTYIFDAFYINTETVNVNSDGDVDERETLIVTKYVAGSDTNTDNTDDISDLTYEIVSPDNLEAEVLFGVPIQMTNGKDGAKPDGRLLYDDLGRPLVYIEAISTGRSNITVSIKPLSQSEYQLIVQNNTVGSSIPAESYILNNQTADLATGLYTETLDSKLIRAFFLPLLEANGAPISQSSTLKVPNRIAPINPTIVVTEDDIITDATHPFYRGINFLQNIPLSGGYDPYRLGPVEEYDYIDAVDRLSNYDCAFISIAGVGLGDYVYQGAIDQLVAQADASTTYNGLRLAVLSAPPNLTKSRASVLKKNYNSDRVVICSGWSTFSNTQAIGINRTSPVGYYLGYLATIDPHVSPASAYGGKGINGILTLDSSTKLDDLDAFTRNNIEVLHVDQVSRSIRWLNGRTTGNTTDTQWVSVRRQADHIIMSLFRNLQWVRSAANTEDLRSKTAAAVNAFLESEQIRGAISSYQPTICNGSNNSSEDIARGKMNILVQWTPVFPADYINVSVIRNYSSRLSLDTAI